MAMYTWPEEGGWFCGSKKKKKKRKKTPLPTDSLDSLDAMVLAQLVQAGYKVSQKVNPLHQRLAHANPVRVLMARVRER